ncbi:MAG: WYL domain-containing protein [Oscillospiraceae bacterium]|nr:WYL domain-containing protein [Oscillospiraceae bacterium]
MESTNKNRLLFLLQYLYENTNDDHKVSTSVLLDLIQENGMKVSRNTLANDIKTIASAGFDIISSNGPSNENLYHWGARPFDLAELKLLIDAVSSARFINQKMSNRLIEKLTSLASFHDKDSLKARIYPSDRIKADNRQIYYIMETINKAIDDGRKISFRYCDIDTNLQLVERNNGEPYINSPYALIWNDDWYYLLGYSDARQKIVTFRVDRMRMPEILDEKAVPAPEGFSAAEYANQAFMMYDGQEEMVILECETGLIKKLADKFGTSFEVEEIGDNRIRARVKVSVSNTFYGWLFTYGGKIKLVGPDDAVKGYRNLLSDAVSAQE